MYEPSDKALESLRSVEGTTIFNAAQVVNLKEINAAQKEANIIESNSDEILKRIAREHNDSKIPDPELHYFPIVFSNRNLANTILSFGLAMNGDIIVMLVNGSATLIEYSDQAWNKLHEITNGTTPRQNQPRVQYY